MISIFAHLGQLNLVEPMVLVILFLHDVHASFSAILIFGIRIWFKKVCFILRFAVQNHPLIKK
jgi:hypothetical protein